MGAHETYLKVCIVLDWASIYSVFTRSCTENWCTNSFEVQKINARSNTNFSVLQEHFVGYMQCLWRNHIGLFCMFQLPHDALILVTLVILCSCTSIELCQSLFFHPAHLWDFWYFRSFCLVISLKWIPITIK